MYAHLGVGTPYGVLGLSLDVAAARWLVFEAGVGANPDEGAEAAFAPRLRLEVFPDGFLTLGSGVSWAQRYAGHTDPLGELVAERRRAPYLGACLFLEHRRWFRDDLRALCAPPLSRPRERHQFGRLQLQ